jgi:hypothetical protein
MLPCPAKFDQPESMVPWLVSFIKHYTFKNFYCYLEFLKGNQNSLLLSTKISLILSFSEGNGLLLICWRPFI